MTLYTPIRTQSSNYDPAKNALVVCAGTVTSESVFSMGAGFNLFHQTFRDPSWHHVQNLVLKFYHEGTAPMPYYLPAHEHGATNDELLGGIATVPAYGGNDLWSKTSLPNDGKDKEAQYKEAVTQAILDAQANHRPLYIQPLGTGVYSWPVHIAARLFMDAIKEKDPEGKLEITIPIYEFKKSSNDMMFKQEIELLYGDTYGVEQINPVPQPSESVGVVSNSSVASLQGYDDMRRLDNSKQFGFFTTTPANGVLKLDNSVPITVGKNYDSSQFSDKPSSKPKPTTIKTVSYDVRSTEPETYGFTPCPSATSFHSTSAIWSSGGGGGSLPASSSSSSSSSSGKISSLMASTQPTQMARIPTTTSMRAAIAPLRIKEPNMILTVQNITQTQQGGFSINAINCNREPRNILVTANGEIRNFQNGTSFNGPVERYLRDNAKSIFQHFATPFPTQGTAAEPVSRCTIS